MNDKKELFNIYKDICKEVEFLEVMLAEAEAEYNINNKLMLKNPENPGTEGYIPLPLDRAAEFRDRVAERYNNIARLLELKKRIKKTAEKHLNQLEGLEYEVAYKRFIEGKTLAEIAEELGYSERHMKRISSNITR